VHQPAGCGRLRARSRRGSRKAGPRTLSPTLGSTNQGRS
jgi:hypothetical protein